MISWTRSAVSATRSEPVCTKISTSACCSSSLTISTPSISIRVAAVVPRSCPSSPAARPLEPFPSRSRSTTITLAPRLASCMAVLSPATPPPITITSAVCRDASAMGILPCLPAAWASSLFCVCRNATGLAKVFHVELHDLQSPSLVDLHGVVRNSLHDQALVGNFK